MLGRAQNPGFGDQLHSPLTARGTSQSGVVLPGKQFHFHNTVLGEFCSRCPNRRHVPGRKKALHHLSSPACKMQVQALSQPPQALSCHITCRQAASWRATTGVRARDFPAGSIRHAEGCDLSVRHLIRLCCGRLQYYIRQHDYLFGVIIDSNECRLYWMAIPLAVRRSRDSCPCHRVPASFRLIIFFRRLEIYNYILRQHSLAWPPPLRLEKETSIPCTTDSNQLHSFSLPCIAQTSRTSTQRVSRGSVTQNSNHNPRQMPNNNHHARGHCSRRPYGPIATWQSKQAICHNHSISHHNNQ